MKAVISKIIFSDRHTLVVLSAAIVTAIAAFIISVSSNDLGRENENLKKELKEIQELGDELIHIKDTVKSKENKIGLTDVSGVVSALEQILKNLGLEAKVIKPFGEVRINEFKEEDAELQIENIDLNKTVNLLYKIENSPVPLKIKSAAIKTTFENRNIFTLNITASLMSKPR